VEEFNRKEMNMRIGTEVVGTFYEGNGSSPAKYPDTVEGD